MDKSRRLWVLAIVLGLGGCGGEEPTAPPANGPAANVPSKAATEKAPAPAAAPEKSKQNDAPPLEAPRTDASKDGAKPVSLTDAQIAKIRTLPAAEQETALKQAICPVSGKHLGAMGTPYRITAEGRTFYLCCDNCVDEVKANPKAVIAKLDER